MSTGLNLSFFTSNAFWKAAEAGPSTWILTTHMGKTWLEFLTPGFGITQNWPLCLSKESSSIEISISLSENY